MLLLKFLIESSSFSYDSLFSFHFLNIDHVSRRIIGEQLVMKLKSIQRTKTAYIGQRLFALLQLKSSLLTNHITIFSSGNVVVKIENSCFQPLCQKAGFFKLRKANPYCFLGHYSRRSRKKKRTEKYKCVYIPKIIKDRWHYNRR